MPRKKSPRTNFWIKPRISSYESTLPKRRYSSIENWVVSGPNSTEQDVLNEEARVGYPISYGLDDAARHIGISRIALDKLVLEEWIPVRGIEGILVIRRLDLGAFIDSIREKSFRGPVPEQLSDMMVALVDALPSDTGEVG